MQSHCEGGEKMTKIQQPSVTSQASSTAPRCLFVLFDVSPAAFGEAGSDSTHSDAVLGQSSPGKNKITIIIIISTPNRHMESSTKSSSGCRGAWTVVNVTRVASYLRWYARPPPSPVSVYFQLFSSRLPVSYVSKIYTLKSLGRFVGLFPCRRATNRFNYHADKQNKTKPCV